MGGQKKEQKSKKILPLGVGAVLGDGGGSFWRLSLAV